MISEKRFEIQSQYESSIKNTREKFEMQSETLE